jgi:hypothetical protein
MTDEQYRQIMLSMWRRTLQYEDLTDDARRRNERHISDLS